MATVYDDGEGMSIIVYPEIEISFISSPYIIPKGRYRGLTYDDVAKKFPKYIEYLIAKKYQDNSPEFKEWLSKRPPSTNPIFLTGKHKGKTYNQVLMTAPRYMFKIMNRGGPMYTKHLAWFENNRERIQKRRLKISGSKGEVSAEMILRKYDIRPSFEYTIASLPHKRFDFMFEARGQRFLLEIDGEQHFSQTKRFHKRVKSFQTYQKTDILKTKAGLSEGYRVIRVAYKNLKELEKHLLAAIQSDAFIYFSDPEMYRYIQVQL